MTQRTNKVSSQVQQIVATEINAQLRLPEVSVTGVDVSPDLRHATIWIGIIKTERNQPAEIFKRVEGIRGELQAAVAHHLTTKFVPRLHIQLDTGGEYAQRINTIINGL